MSAFARVTDALEEHGCRREGTNWQCPAHEDHKPSLSVSNGDGRVLIHCHAGCPLADVLEPLGLRQADLFDDSPDPARANGSGPTANGSVSAPPVALPIHYTYVTVTGDPMYRVTRTHRLDGSKDFRQARYLPGDSEADRDGYVSRPGCMNGAERVLYRLPEVIAAVAEGREIYEVEGEKDADRLAMEGVTATTNAQGAGKRSTVRDHARELLQGASVVVVQDKDETGRRHAREVVASLVGVASSVQLVEVREGNDVSDHLDAGYTLAELVPVDPEQSTGQDVKQVGQPGADVLNAVHAFIGRFVAYPSPHAHVAHTLCIA